VSQRAQLRHEDRVESIAMVHAKLDVSEVAHRVLGEAERMVGASEGCLEVAQRCTRPTPKMNYMNYRNFDATQLPNPAGAGQAFAKDHRLPAVDRPTLDISNRANFAM
jgi:hypothetical protein